MKYEVNDVVEFQNDNDFWDGNHAAVVEVNDDSYQLEIIDGSRSQQRNVYNPEGTIFRYRFEDAKKHLKYVGERKEDMSFTAQVTRLPVGSVFQSPYTGEPMVKITEDKVLFELNTGSPVIKTLNNLLGVVAPIKVLYRGEEN